MMQTELNPLICSLVATPRRMAAMPRYVGRFYVVFESMLERALPRVSRGLLAYVGAVERRLLYGSWAS